VLDSKTALQDLEATCDPGLKEKWSQQASQAQRDRDAREDAMDIYDVTIEKGIFSIPFSGYTMIEPSPSSGAGKGSAGTNSRRRV